MIAFCEKIIIFKKAAVSFLFRPFTAGLLFAQNQPVELGKTLVQFLTEGLLLLGIGTGRTSGAGPEHLSGGALILLRGRASFIEFLQGLGQYFIIGLSPARCGSGLRPGRRTATAGPVRGGNAAGLSGGQAGLRGGYGNPAGCRRARRAAGSGLGHTRHTRHFRHARYAHLDGWARRTG